MKRYNFNKLIRSNLPERMKKEGVYLSGRPLTDEEFAKELKNKLVEEAGEVQDTQSREDLIKELADVMEVIETLTSLRGITKEEIEKERLLKCQINGHFLAANFVDYIEVPITNRKVIEYLQKRNRPYQCN
jgi:predicted house-cleaning noncanonical NTP pyrophosphatase (MazG superfamily)